jgi:predicted nucleic acid-binding protein
VTTAINRPLAFSAKCSYPKSYRRGACPLRKPKKPQEPCIGPVTPGCLVAFATPDQIEGEIMVTKIYIDTSIVGGYFDDEFSTETKALFERLKNKELVFIISSVLLQELQKAPQDVRTLLENYDKSCFEYVELSSEAIDLADKYISEKVVGKTSIDDCRHIAIATIYKADVLASWNFKHIVNLERIKGYNGVNLKYGYSGIEIRNPRELLKYDSE